MSLSDKISLNRKRRLVLSTSFKRGKEWGDPETEESVVIVSNYSVDVESV